MWWMFAAQAGMSLLSSASSSASSNMSAKARKKLQEYNNQMARLSDAMNQNAITTNVTLAIQNSALLATDIQKSAIQAAGAVDVQAASTNTVGRSVDLVMNEVARGAATQEYTRQQDLQATFLQADQQRAQSAQSAKLNEDYSYIPTQSTASTLFNSAQGVFSAWQSTYGSTSSTTSKTSSAITPGNYGSATGQGNTSKLLRNKYSALF